MADKNDKVVKGDFAPRLNFGISAGIEYPFENDEMLLVRLEVDVNGKKQPDYHIIMKDQDNE